MKTLRLFNTHSAYEDFIENGENTDTVCVCKEHRMIFYPGSTYKCNLEYDEQAYEDYLKDEDKKLEIVPFGNTLWAKVNLGATYETDNDIYFTFGNNEGHESVFGVDRHSSEMENIDPSDTSIPSSSSTKFSSIKNMISESSFNQYYFSDKSNLSSFSDAAQVRLGENITRTPTLADVNELLDNSTRVWTTLYGVEGVKFISNQNSEQYIFIPAAGYCEWQDVYESQEGNPKSAYIWLKELSSNTYQQEKWVLNNAGNIYTKTNETRKYGKCLRCRQNGNSVDCDIVDMKQFRGVPIRWIINRYQLSGISNGNFVITEYVDDGFVNNNYTLTATTAGTNQSYNVTDGSTTKVFNVYSSYIFTLSRNGVNVATYKINKTSGPSTSETVNVANFNFIFELSRTETGGQERVISNYYATVEGVVDFNTSSNSNFYFYKNGNKSSRYTYVTGLMRACVPQMEYDYLCGKLIFNS